MILALLHSQKNPCTQKSPCRRPFPPGARIEHLFYRTNVLKSGEIEQTFYRTSVLIFLGDRAAQKKVFVLKSIQKKVFDFFVFTEKNFRFFRFHRKKFSIFSSSQKKIFDFFRSTIHIPGKILGFRSEGSAIQLFYY